MRRTTSCVAGLAVLATLSGCGKDKGSPAEVDNAAPVARFVAECEARWCTFNESSTDADGTIVAWRWEFGDGTESTEQDVVHEYAASGNFTVKLTVTDDVGATHSRTRTVTTVNPETTSLTCVDGSAPGGVVACKLSLAAPAGFKVKLESIDCRAHGNLFRITEPVQDTLVTDGCYEEVGKEIVHAGPFPTGTEIAAEVIAPLLGNPPALRVEGAYPQWTIKYEDGDDSDFNDLIMTVTALPVTP